MMPAVRLLRPLGTLPLLQAREWSTHVGDSLRGGARLVTMFGRPDVQDHVLLTAVLQGEDGALEIVRGTAARATGVHTLTRDFPAAHVCEREMHEQLGLRVADHPWLKPIRYEGASIGRMASYPFYRLEGKEVHEVAVGPIHAGVIEPGAFRFSCLGETVHHLEIQLGYQHRAVESMLLRGDPLTRTPLVETVAGDSSIAHAWAHCGAIEALAGVVTRPAAEASRRVGLELERIAMHLSTLAGMAQDVGFAQGAATYGRLRTTAINTTMRLCGSRFGRGWLRPGGSMAVMDAEVAEVVRGNTALIRNDVAIMNARFLGSATVQHRLHGVGEVARRDARALGLVGVASRASGVSLDQRAHLHPFDGTPEFEPCVETTGDCWARARVRICEIDRSLDIIAGTIARFPGFGAGRAPIAGLAADSLVVSMIEGTRGEVVHAIETDAAGRVRHYKLQDPSLRNWFGLALALRGNEISDFPICNKSFDLSYCGNDL
jgi:Ni,Fe-hydrogenase III large subunit